MPSIGDVLFVSIFLRLLFLGGTLLNDGDTGWHLVAGETILRTLSVPHVDVYSFTAPGATWVSHEWLSELIFALSNRLGGLNGVVFLSATVIAFTFWLLYDSMLRRGIGPLVSAAVTILAASVSTGNMLARPHILSIPLTLIFYDILQGHQAGQKDRLLFLPFLTLVWVNLHAGFFIGLVIVLIYAAGNLAYWYIGESGAESSKKARRLFLVLSACILAALVNPEGPAIYKFVSDIPKIIGSEDMLWYIVEFASPNFHETKAFEAMLLGIAAILVLSRRKPDLFEGGLLVMLMHLSLSSVRFIPLFAIITVPIAATRLGDAARAAEGLLPASIIIRLKTRFGDISGNLLKMESGLRGHLPALSVVAAAALFVFGGVKTAGINTVNYGFNPDRFPVGAFDFAVKNKINGRMFNNYGWGGYLIYKGSPGYKVFIHGRTEVYGPKMMKEYLTVSRAQFGCMEILDKYKVDWVMFDADTPLCRLLEAKGWEKVYSDQTAEILLRRKSL